MKALQLVQSLLATLPVVGPGFIGPTARLLRDALRECGYGPAVWDSLPANHPKGNEYTDTLRDALLSFQRATGLAPDGVAGPKTFAKLASYATDNTPEGLVRRAFVARAISYNGCREKPGKKRNRGEPMETFIRHGGGDPESNGDKGVAYCAYGLTYCLDKGCEASGCTGQFQIDPYVPYIVRDAKKQGRLIQDPAEVRAGDLWIWVDGGRKRHVEVCTGPVKNGMVPTFGFNTGDGSINAGDGCYPRLRPVAGMIFVNACRGVKPR